MKPAALVLCALAAACAAAPKPKRVEEHLLDLLEVGGVAKMVRVLEAYVANDDRVLAAAKYLTGAEFADMLRGVAKTPQFAALKKLLKKVGLDLKRVLKGLGEKKDNDRRIVPSDAERDMGGVRALVKALTETVPWPALREALEGKVATNADFRKFYDAITGEEFVEAAKALAKTQEFTAMLRRLRGLGLVGLDVFVLLGATP